MKIERFVLCSTLFQYAFESAKCTRVHHFDLAMHMSFINNALDGKDK